MPCDVLEKPIVWLRRGPFRVSGFQGFGVSGFQGFGVSGREEVCVSSGCRVAGVSRSEEEEESNHFNKKEPSEETLNPNPSAATDASRMPALRPLVEALIRCHEKHSTYTMLPLVRFFFECFCVLGLPR